MPDKVRSWPIEFRDEQRLCRRLLKQEEVHPGPTEMRPCDDLDLVQAVSIRLSGRGNLSSRLVFTGERWKALDVYIHRQRLRWIKYR